MLSAAAPSHKPDRPIAMPSASPSRLNHTPPPEDVPRAITPEPEEPEETTVYLWRSPQEPGESLVITQVFCALIPSKPGRIGSLRKKSRER